MDSQLQILESCLSFSTHGFRYPGWRPQRVRSSTMNSGFVLGSCSHVGYGREAEPPPFLLRFLSWRRAVFRLGRYP